MLRKTSLGLAGLVTGKNQVLRSLAVYEECAVMQELAYRQDCCDLKVKSKANRDFCYNEVIYPEDEFKLCAQINDLVNKFACCDFKSNGDDFMAEACKKKTREDECSTEAECLQEYKNDLEYVKQARREEMLRQKKEQVANSKEEYMTPFMVFIIIFVPAFCTLFYLYFAYTSKCFREPIPCFRKKEDELHEQVKSDDEVGSVHGSDKTFANMS